jgi:hypothetical protein
MLYRVASLFVLFVLPAVARADAFDHYFNKVLAAIPESKNAVKTDKVTNTLMVKHSRVLAGVGEAFLVVKTNDKRWAKLLVRPAGHKISDDESKPIVIIERYVTFREGEERTIQASGQNVRLFEDFRFSLDIGQVVPKDIAADLRVGVDKGNVYLEPIGKAEIYIVTKHLPEANPPKTGKLVVGDKFEMHYFNGAYKLYDDGRRSGTMHIKVAENGVVTGHYFSDKDGQKYEVEGKVSSSTKNMIDFTITYPRVIQTFTGFLFTGDGKAMTGSSRLDNRETGFYALRIEDEK